MSLAKKGIEINYPNFKDTMSPRDYAWHQADMNC
jgi:hypothetical protein